VEGGHSRWAVFLNEEVESGQKDHNGRGFLKGNPLSMETQETLKDQRRGILVRFWSKVKERRNLEAGLQGLQRENHKGRWKSHKRTDYQRLIFQEAKSGRLPWTEQIPGTEAAGLDLGFPPKPSGETNRKRE
jgi:hypothetical protein